MIKSLTLYKGQKVFTNKLYNHSKKDVTFEFADGINIITGRNASGKSVLLKIIKTLCCIDEATYPSMPHPIDLHNFLTDIWFTIPEYISEKLEKKDFPKSSILWDGSMVHYLTPEYFDSRNLWTKLDSPYSSSKEIFSMGEVLNKMMTKNSQGESIIHLLMKLYELNTEYDKPLTNVNNSWLKASDTFQNWINSFPKDGKPTLLIDELDLNLDLDNQKTYWDYVKNLTKKWQVIVISHSYFAFKQTDVNHIPLNKQYFNQVKKL
jgi:predicted ATP-dependent endonuclease of OLD family